MPGCSANDCTNRTEQGFALKSFPRDPQRRKLWAAEVKRLNWIPTNSSSLCEVHFEADQWKDFASKKLKKTAVPTIFSHRPENFKRKVPKERAAEANKKLCLEETQPDSSEEAGLDFKAKSLKSQQSKDSSKELDQPSSFDTSISTSSSTKSALPSTIVQTAITPNFQTAANTALTFNPGTPVLLTSQLQSPGPLFFFRTQPNSSREVGPIFKMSSLESKPSEDPSKQLDQSESFATSRSTSLTGSAQPSKIVQTAVAPKFQTAASSAQTFNLGAPILLTSNLQPTGPFFLIHTQANSSEKVSSNFKMSSLESKASENSSKEWNPSKSFATSISTSLAELSTIVQTTVTPNFPAADSSAQTFNLGTRTFSTSKLQSTESSSTEYILPDSVRSDESPPLLACVNSSKLTQDNVLDSHITIKQEIIETEEDIPDSSFLQSSGEGHSRFQTQNLENYQKRVERTRLNFPVACSSKNDPSENSEVSEANYSQDPFDVFGLFVASKLRNLDRKLCPFVQKSIADRLFEAEWGLFLTPQEKISFEEKNDCIMKRLHEAVVDSSSVGPSC